MQQLINPELLNELIRSRRSIFPRQYNGQRIPDSIIEQLLINANWAPNHGNTEPWRFFVFADEGRQLLSDFQAELYKELTPPDQFQAAKYEKLKKNPLLASHVIALAMKRQTSGKIPEIEEIEAVACAVQNMYLTASAYGVGAYWGSGGVTYMEEAKEFFGLGSEDKLLGFFYLGYTDEPHPEGKRGDVTQKTTWITEKS